MARLVDFGIKISLPFLLASYTCLWSCQSVLFLKSPLVPILSRNKEESQIFDTSKTIIIRWKNFKSAKTRGWSNLRNRTDYVFFWIYTVSYIFIKKLITSEGITWQLVNVSIIFPLYSRWHLNSKSVAIYHYINHMYL